MLPRVAVFIVQNKKRRKIRLFLFLQELVSVYANLLLVLSLLLELNLTVDKSEEGVILTDTNVGTGMDSCSSLSYDNVAGNYCLTVSSLNAKTLGFAITAVLSRTNTLLMSKEL